ncbi:hypothetical protein JG687_00009974 [Phytophthora cactorum]|uniref:Uncharacterized protein n=1 Tax=Phytophthora cactorum TaxID=29920 RepID=A0A8T1U833_9STRA|nr:hypothetical protein JG687_00009974 [Phytophthora cactorum]
MVQRTMEIFKWMEWIVARNEALSEVGRPDDELVGFGYVHLVEDIGAIHVPHDYQSGGTNRGGYGREPWDHF